VVDPVGAQRRSQWIGHLRLTDQLGKGLWPVTAIQGCNHPLIVVAAADSAAGAWARAQSLGRVLEAYVANVGDERSAGAT